MRTFKQAILTTAAFAVCGAAGAAPRPVHHFLRTAISPDGARIAAVEGDETPSGGIDTFSLVIHAATDGTPHPVALPCDGKPQCRPAGLAWSPDSKTLAFALRTPGSHDYTLYTVGSDGGAPAKRTAFHGTLDDLRYSPGGTLAVLAIADAAKEVGAVEAGAPITGELGADVHEQRIAILQPDGSFKWASPDNLFVYEYDWTPDGSGFVATAAPGDGDNHWWVAKLYDFSAKDGTGTVIYTPANQRQQLAVPRVSPDGKSVSFIGGIMSDFGSTGGEAFVLPLGAAGAKAVDITPKLPATVTALAWACDGKSLLASELAADQRRIVSLPPTPGGTAQVLAASQESVGGTDDPVSISCATGRAALVHTSFTTPSEIEAGRIGQWHDITHANEGLSAAVEVKNVVWKSDGKPVQGWLLLPKNAPAGKKLAMVTVIHGGPAAAAQPQYAGTGWTSKLLGAGYAVFAPNPRGSYGQGEAFTLGNVRDFGHGDLRDDLAGITAAEAVAPIDENRLGVMGWSYGGYMTMWTVTQTNRFKAAVAGAGIANWQSYYGQNGIDAWMIPYFGASVYDDPAVYAKSSPINFIKHVKTPTLEVVGENDVECPAPQTQEFWHALQDLGVPTTSVIYPGEGHAMRTDPRHLEDFEKRFLAWFAKYLG